MIHVLCLPIHLFDVVPPIPKDAQHDGTLPLLYAKRDVGLN
jgi:hypothetical protein